MHIEIHIDEYLRGELSDERAREVAEHLARCDRCREHLSWHRTLQEMTSRARIEHPPEVLDTLEARLLTLPDRLEDLSGAAPVRPQVRRWLRGALQAAALVLLGVGLGWVVRGGPDGGASDLPGEALAPGMETASRMMADREAALQDRVQELEEALISTYLTRVETALMHFVDDASAGSLTSGDAGTYQDLLSMTANLKADSRSRGDEQLGRLCGRVEAVLMEIERLNRERDFPAARHVAELIEEQGLLSSLQRMKVGVE